MAGSTVTSSIAIASIGGVTTNAATTSPTPRLGDILKFATTVELIAGRQYPMVDVSCYQDVNDGFVDTTLLGPDIVFTWLDKPAADFTLGG